jgi:uncharacterized alkaline shock family protein YloU
MAKKLPDSTQQDVINIEDAVFKKLVFSVLKSKNDSVQLEKDDDVSLSKKEKNIEVDMKLNVIYGKNILTVVHDIQREIKNSIEEYTCYKATSINIEVKNITNNTVKEEEPKSVEKKKTKRSSD